MVTAPEAQASEAGDRLADVMISVFQRYVPDVAGAVKAEPMVMSRMYKGAETVRDEHGRLQEWAPS
jgi:hypothetical protein